MTYGEAKTRDMARSILPATNRRDARHTAASIKRHNRRVTRQALHEWKSYEDPLEYEGHIYGYDDSPATGGEEGPKGNIKSHMWDRRNHDKLNHFIRWAEAATAHLDDPHARYMYIKKILPDNLIGRHALSHLEFVEAFNYRADVHSRYTFTAPRKMLEAPTHDEVYALVSLDLKKLNAKIKATQLRVEYEASLRTRTYGRRTVEDMRKDYIRRNAPRLCQGLDDDEFFRRAVLATTPEGKVVLEMLGRELEPTNFRRLARQIRKARDAKAQG